MGFIIYIGIPEQGMTDYQKSIHLEFCVSKSMKNRFCSNVHFVKNPRNRGKEIGKEGIYA